VAKNRELSTITKALAKDYLPERGKTLSAEIVFQKTFLAAAASIALREGEGGSP
jgi:hypothetical protein